MTSLPLRWRLRGHEVLELRMIVPGAWLLHALKRLLLQLPMGCSALGLTTTRNQVLLLEIRVREGASMVSHATVWLPVMILFLRLSARSMRLDQVVGMIQILHQDVSFEQRVLSRLARWLNNLLPN